MDIVNKIRIIHLNKIDLDNFNFFSILLLLFGV